MLKIIKFAITKLIVFIYRAFKRYAKPNMRSLKN